MNSRWRPAKDQEEKKMKKLLSVLLGIALLCCAFAAAAEATELPYLETEDQDVYLSSTVLTEASYPKICITPYSEYNLFERDKDEPMYVVLPCPEGMRCESFGISKANFLKLDASTACEYYYEAVDRWSYEDFLLKVENEEYILMDGSEGIAAYINPERAAARALFGLDEIQKGAKLYVEIHMQNFSKKEDAEKVKLLTDAIQAEITRVKENMTIAKADNLFWTNGTFKGIKLFSSSVTGKVFTMDLPQVAFNLSEEISGQAFVTNVSGNSFAAYVVPERGKYVSVKGSIDSYSYVNYDRDESEITKVTLSDGNEWQIYVANENDGKPYSIYAARVLNEGKDDKPIQLTLQFGVDNQKPWENVEAFTKDLDTFAKCVKTEAAQ